MRTIKIIGMITFILYFAGCSSFLKYRKNKWETKAAVEEMKITKLDHQPVKADSINGYWGIIDNCSKQRGYSTSSLAHFYFTGPETFSVSLSAGGKPKGKYLLPGTYRVVVSYRGNPVDTAIFHSDNRLHDYDGIDVHWYVSWTNSRYY